MFSLRFRLVTVIALALFGGALSQAAGAGSSDVRPLAPGSTPAAIISALTSGHTPRVALPGVLRGLSLRAGFRGAAAGTVESKALSALGAGFTDTGTSFGPSVIFSVTSADYDADGRLDVLTDGCVDAGCTDVGFKLYHNNGDGTFSENTAAGLPSSWIGSSSWGDYDSDGYVDVLITGCSLESSCTAIESRLYHNNGNGTFSLDTKAALPGSIFGLYSALSIGVFSGNEITWFDYNNDGRLDLLIGAAAVGITAKVPAPVNFSARIFRNNGDGSFSEATNSGLPGYTSLTSQTADYNGDGYVDVLINGCSDADCTSLATKLYRNNGNGTFSASTRAVFPSLLLYQAVWSDFDGDGAPDLVTSGVDITTSDYKVEYFRNNGDGTFSENTASGLPNLSDVLISCGDYDSDGHVDILFNGAEAGTLFSKTAVSGYVSRIYHNKGDGTFSVMANAGLPDDFAWFTHGDYNSDRGLDLLMYDAPPLGNAVIYQNATTSGGGLFYTPDGLRVRLTGARQLTFTWNESESKTRDNHLTYNLRVGTKPGASDVVAAMSNADGVRSLPADGNAGERTFVKVTLPHKGNFYWSVQAVNASLVGSVFAQEKKFTVPGRVSLNLSNRKINTCGVKPRRTAATGRVNPIFTPVATIVLKRRFSPHGAWREIMRRQTSHTGVYGFHGIGKGITRSFWLRVVVRPKAGGSVTSRAKRVKVHTSASCLASG
jgi:FG-GAP-like repeat